MVNDKIDWITVNHRHIPIQPGQDKGEAIKDFFDNYEDDVKSNDYDEPRKPQIVAARYYWNDNEVSASFAKRRKSEGSNIRIEEESLPKEPSFMRAYSKLPKMESYKKAAESTNPHFDTGKYEWTYNCQRCVIAFEMRYRGYNVTAKPRLNRDDDIVFKDVTAWNKSFKNFEWDELARYYPGDNARNYLLIQKEIRAKYPCGSRFIFHIKWRKHQWQNKANTHVVIGILNDEKELEFYDPQSGKKSHWRSNANVGDTKWCRIDDKEFTDLISNCVYNEGEDNDEITEKQE